jgi:hypothetical protein
MHSSIERFSVRKRISSDAARDRRIFAVLRIIAVVGLLFGAFAFGLWVGLNWPADSSPFDQGVMDFTY